MSEDRDNIIPFDRWKTLYNNSEKERSFTEYLQVLDFSELISESSEIIKELKNSNLNLDLTSRSKQILKEFDNRLSTTSKHQAESVRNLRENTERKIINIEDSLK